MLSIFVGVLVCLRYGDYFLLSVCVISPARQRRGLKAAVNHCNGVLTALVKRERLQIFSRMRAVFLALAASGAAALSDTRVTPCPLYTPKITLNQPPRVATLAMG